MARLQLLGLPLTVLNHTRFLRPAASLLSAQPVRNFYEKDRKGGYGTPQKKYTKENIRQGVRMLGPEFRKFKEEVSDYVTTDQFYNFMFPEHGDYWIEWQFNSQEAVDDWLFTADRENKEGKSRGEFVLGNNKTGLFRGCLNTTVPEDGQTKAAGYCSIRSPRNWLSFKRARPYDWKLYTHVLMRLRGDGRSYQLGLGLDQKYDINYHDLYAYPLYTRGGPYWQIAKIPFSKFILSAKGRVQDRQGPLRQDKISYMVITLADNITGPFHLEIDYIGLVYDETHKQHFEYEMYEVPSYQMY